MPPRKNINQRFLWKKLEQEAIQGKIGTRDSSREKIIIFRLSDRKMEPEAIREKIGIRNLLWEKIETIKYSPCSQMITGLLSLVLQHRYVQAEG